MKLSLTLRTGLALILLSPASLHAAVTDFTWNPSNPVMGELVPYTAVTDDNPPSSVTSYK